MPALDLVVLLARNARVATTLERESSVLHLDADLFASNPGELRGHDEGLGRLAEIHRRCPSLWTGGNALQSMLDREEVPQRVPSCKRHVLDSNTGDPTSRTVQNPGSNCESGRF